MYFFTLVFGVVLLPGAHSLKCYACKLDSKNNCKDEVQCSARCGALRILSYVGTAKVAEVVTKSCFSADQCVTGSVNFGTARTQILSKCCSTDFCNAGTLTASASSTKPNGKKCFTCKGSDCTETLECQGAEDHCISSSVKMGSERMPMKGCATEQICSNHEQIPGSFGVGISCCKGDLCNSASSAGVLLPLLLAPLLTSVVF